jgi:hypothetical protein
MTKPRPPKAGILLLALLAAAGCSKRTAPVETRSEPAGAASLDAAAPRDTIAPLILAAPFKADTITKEDFHWAKETGATVDLDETFLLELGMGDGRDGLNVTTVPASGHASHVYQTEEKGGVRWSRVTFDVDRAEIERLVKVLNEHGFLHLAQGYQAKGVNDGAQWIVHVRTGGLDKYVYADNVFPEPLVAVARFVSEQIVDTRPKLRAESRPARLGRGYGDHLWRAVRRYAVKSLEPGIPDFEDAPRVLGLVVPDDPLPQGTRLQVSIVDLTDEGKVLSSSSANAPRFVVFYNEAKVEPRHRYVLELKLLSGTKVVAAGEPVPVLTLDGAHAVEVPLTASGQ